MSVKVPADIKLKISASEATFGRKMFDSRMEFSYISFKNNAFLVLDLNVKLFFVNKSDTAGELAHKVITQGGKTYAKDYDGKLFPMLDWKDNEKKALSKQFESHGECFWTNRFWLKHRDSTYSKLDTVVGDKPPWTIRPNVCCKLNIKILASGDTGEHIKINVFKLDPKATQYLDASGVAHNIGARNSGTFRSDSGDYDNLDWKGRNDTFNKSDYTATDWDDTTKKIFHKKARTFVTVYHDTIAHELGHALNQEHIMFLKYNHNKPTAGAAGSADEYKGKGLEDTLNVMGGGSLLGPENAISWTERLGEHTKTKADDWVVSMSYLHPHKVTT